MSSVVKQIFVFSVLFLSFASARAPLESYKNYLMVMVHGVGANTQLPNDYDISFGSEYVKGAPRKSSIFDRSADDDRGFGSSAADSNWQGDIGGSLQKRGFWGHTMWYDFYQPWRTPIYDANDPNKQISLSRYLGDRSVKDNPMGSLRPIYRYFIGDTEFKNAAEAVSACNDNMDALFTCVENTTISGFSTGGVGALAGGALSCNNTTNGKKIIFTNPIECINNIVVDSSSRAYFGQTANSRWLHEFFPDDLLDDDKVEYKGHTGDYLTLAQKDWKLWHKLRYGKDAAEEDVPKKYILIAHSMGGLTTRDYLTGPFYKGDVDKLITLDSPHEGSEIANYVQYWHYSAIDKNGWVRFGSKAFDMALTIPLTLSEIAESCGLSVIKDPLTLSAKWVKTLSVLSTLYKPELLQEVSNSIANSLSGYHENAMVFGDQFVEQGIDVMTLSDYYNQTPDVFLRNFNARKKLNDPNENGYDLPYFEIVSTSGVPTPGSPGLDPYAHKDITTSYFNIPAILSAALEAGVNSLDDLSNDGYMLNLLHRVAAPILLQSIWNDDGSGFVPGWSAEGNRVSLFSQKNADIDRYKVSFDYEETDKIEGIAHTIAAVGAVIGTFLILKQLEVLDLSIPDGVKCAWNILSSMGMSAMLANMFDINDFPIGPFKEEVYRYAGFHGYMVKKVDVQKASDAGNTDKKLLDQLLWEAPSVSFTFNPVDPWDNSQGGYVGMATTAEKVDVTATSIGDLVPVMWDGENSSHEFDIDLMDDLGETEESHRKKTIFIAGKKAGTHLKQVTYSYNQKNEEGVEEKISKTISFDKCEATGGVFRDNTWTVEKDDEGIISCEMDLSNGSKYNITLTLNAYAENGDGALLVDVGREPGKVFIAGNNSLVMAENTDWDRYITFKNKRYQKKNNVEKPKDEDLDKTVAQMVDYRRTPLLVVNKLPRVFELEVDDLQPDRMRKIEILFNFGSSKIVYESVRDPNSFDKAPAGFKNQPEGFIDPSQEKYTVTVSIGEESVSKEIDNPVDAWGKFHVDMESLETLLGKTKGWLQPFLEGRNHLRIHSVNRWGMSRVQDMNLFIPGPPPTVQMVRPLADDAFCGKTKLIFKTNLIYNQASELQESDIDVGYSDVSGKIYKVSGFKIEKETDGSNTLYKVSSNDEIDWPSGSVAVNIKVTACVNGSATSPVNYVFTMTRDCEPPTIEISSKQEIYNPSNVMFTVADKIETGGEADGVIEDLLIELNKIGTVESKLLIAVQFSAPGAKVLNIDVDKKENGEFAYPDGSYILSVRAHDNTIEGDEADVKRKAFWNTYGESLPDTKLPFAKYCSPTTDEACMTQWAYDSKKIVIDRTAPSIDEVTSNLSINNKSIVVTSNDKEFFVEIKATEELIDELNGVRADVTMTACDFNGKELFSFTQSGNGTKEDGKDKEYKIKIDIFDAPNEDAEMYMQEKSSIISDGLYGMRIAVRDASNNVTEFETINIHLDRTAPRILNINVPYSPSSGEEHQISFDVDEMDDADVLRDPQKITARVYAECGGEPVEYEYDKLGSTVSTFKYKATIPSDVAGECIAVISAMDGVGNERKSENKFVVDWLLPEITSPSSDGAKVSGRIAIYGSAEAPYLNKNTVFAWYELSYVKLDETGAEEGGYVSNGISVPNDKKCADANRGCKPVSKYDASNILGYWDTGVLNASEGDLYRIKLTTSDGVNRPQYAYRVVMIGEDKESASTIKLNVSKSHVDFGTDKDVNICWNVESSDPNMSSMIRLEILRNSSTDGEGYTYLSKIFENPVMAQFLGEPEQSSSKGAYLWIDENDKDDEISKYHLRLVSGSQKTSFHLAFYSLDEEVILLKNGNEIKRFNKKLETNTETYSRISVEFDQIVDAGMKEDFVLQTRSQKGLRWTIANSYMTEGDDDPVKLYKMDSQDVYAFFGKSASKLAGLSSYADVNVPSVLGGRCYAWNGKLDQKNVSVPSGNYKVTATLENQKNNQTVDAYAYIDVVGAQVNITEEQVTPKVVPFSPVINSNVTLSFKIDQDAKVSVFARKKKCSLENEETDLEEYMNLALNGSNVSLNKRLLAGSDVPYVINWNGWYNKTNAVKPYACGYEFVVQAYDMDGKNKLAEKTVDFDVEAKDMLEDPSNDVLLYVDGDNTNTVERNNKKYLVAQGMNDAVLEFSPRGKRILRDEVGIDLKYKGKQLVETIPFERYSVGIQVHKPKIDYWVVLGAHYTRLREKEGSCGEETKQATHVSVQDMRFDEDHPLEAKQISANFSDYRSTDLKGRMNYAYVSALLIPKAKMSKTEIGDIAKIIDKKFEFVSNIEDDIEGDDQDDVEEGEYSLTEDIGTCDDCENQAAAWESLKNAATIKFDWQTEPLFGKNLSSTYDGINGVKSSGRESEADYMAKFDVLNSAYQKFHKEYGMPAVANSTNLWWHSGCDLGEKIPAGVVCQVEGFDLKTFCETRNDPTCGNGIYDVGEPTLAAEYNEDKHKPEMNAYAYAWKNTDGSNKEYDPIGCLGCSGCRRNLKINLTVVPTERFWANDVADYGWQNDVNRYLSLDPLNTNFLFGESGPFKAVHPRFLSKNGKPVEFNLKNSSTENNVLAKQSLITLLHNITLQKFYMDEKERNVYTGELDDDVQMILHYFKIEPNSRKYYPLNFNVGVNVDGVTQNFSMVPNYKSNPISLGGYKSGKDLVVSISMDKGNEINAGHPDYTTSQWFDWPMTGTVPVGNCKNNAYCGDNESDVLYTFDNTLFDDNSDDSYVSNDGYLHFTRKVKLTTLPDDVNGYDVSSYLKTGDSKQNAAGELKVTYLAKQGPVDDELEVTKSPVVTIYEASAELAADYQDDYGIYDDIVFRKDAYKGVDYVAKNDPLLSKIDDDGDGQIAEDERDAYDIDDDGDLAIDEDPSDAIRVRVNAQFPFVGGGSSAPEISYNIAELIRNKVDEHNVNNPQNTVVPGSSDESGWSVFKSDWTDAEDLLTQWESSNNVSSFERTGVFYKDGKKNTDVKISNAKYMDDFDATKASLVLKPDEFDGRDRRVIEVRGQMPYNNQTDKYEIYVSSETGWINLTPEKPRTTDEHTLKGTLAYWDVTTSGFHQLLLIRHVNGDKYYKVFDVAVGQNNTQQASDALGRAQISTSYEMDFVDVVPLGADEIPQTIPGGLNMGPVVQIYPAASLFKDALTVRIRYTRDEVCSQKWTEDASIYVVGPNESPVRLQGITWTFYDAQSREIHTKIDSGDWEYAVIAGVLPKVTSNDGTEKTVNMGESTKVTSPNGDYSVTVNEQENNAFEITVDGE